MASSMGLIPSRQVGRRLVGLSGGCTSAEGVGVECGKWWDRGELLCGGWPRLDDLEGTDPIVPLGFVSAGGKRAQKESPHYEQGLNGETKSVAYRC